MDRSGRARRVFAGAASGVVLRPPARHATLTPTNVMSWWIWTVIGFLLLCVEFASTTMHVGLFAVGAFVVAIVVGAGADLPLWGQIVIFTITSLLSFFFLRPMIMKRLKLDQKKVVDSLVGEQAMALEDMAVGGNGRAEMRGTTWG